MVGQFDDGVAARARRAQMHEQRGIVFFEQHCVLRRVLADPMQADRAGPKIVIDARIEKGL